MLKWQRRARLLLAVFLAAFTVLLVFAFRRRVPPPAAEVSGRTDPNAILESTGGHVIRVNGTREDASIEFERQVTYKDGSSRLLGVKVTSAERGGRTFVVTAQEGVVQDNESTIVLQRDVRISASDGLAARTEHATYTERDGFVRAPGPVDFTRGRLSGSGVGMTYDKNQDILTILDRAVVRAS